MKTGIYLSIRNKATRLPNKSLLPLGGKPLVVFILDRLKEIKGEESVVLCTSDHNEDVILTQWAKESGVSFFQGNQGDKLHRYYETSKAFDHEAMLIIDGDDPFVSIDHAKQTIVALEETDADLVLFDNLPTGAMAFGLKRATLQKYFEHNKEGSTEVWAPILRTLPDLRELTLYEADSALTHTHARLTIDYEEDYRFCSAVIKTLESQNQDISYPNIISLLRNKPELTKINSKVRELYEENLAQLVQTEKTGNKL
ncbi:cytidylyltransferase domain-containing protein [Kiloniella litopenaei]|uniref:cytidylyltransferase domain-containing protein n=1 Tax=Kiloniella litopenaei TaxID=1549748 RepID=UPI003BA8C453